MLLDPWFHWLDLWKTRRWFKGSGFDNNWGFGASGRAVCVLHDLLKGQASPNPLILKWISFTFDIVHIYSIIIIISLLFIYWQPEIVHLHWAKKLLSSIFIILFQMKISKNILQYKLLKLLILNIMTILFLVYRLFKISFWWKF